MKMKKQKVPKTLPVVTAAKHMEKELLTKFRDTPSEAKISGNVTQNFSRVLDIVAIPGWGVEVQLRPTKEDPTTSRRMSYYQALEIVVQMGRMLAKTALADDAAVVEMFTKFKMKLLEAINSDPI